MSDLDWCAKGAPRTWRVTQTKSGRNFAAPFLQLFNRIPFINRLAQAYICHTIRRQKTNMRGGLEMLQLIKQINRSSQLQSLIEPGSRLQSRRCGLTL